MNKKYVVKLFISGVLAFTISQIVLRVPLLNIIANSLKVYKFQIAFPLIYGFLVSLSAGIFEESARFIFRFKLFNNHNTILEPIIFGLGHGLIEVVYVLILLVQNINLFNPSYLGLILYERLLAVIFHIGMTVIIWNGFLFNRKYRNLFTAILFHGLFNFLITLNKVYNWGTTTLYGAWTIIILIIVIYVYKSRNIKGGENDEKI